MAFYEESGWGWDLMGYVQAESAFIVPTDGPGDFYVPETARQWESLDLIGPSHFWTCQQLSGSLIDLGVPSVPLSKTGVGSSHGNVVAGWSRVFAGIDGTNGIGFNSSSANLNVALDESFAYLYLASAQTPAAQRTICTAGSGWGVGVNTTGTLRLFGIAGSANGVPVTADLTVVHPVLWGRNFSTGVFRLFSDLEQLNGVYSGAAFAGTKGIGATSAATARIGAIWFWRGADAEVILDKTTLQKLNWPLSY